MFNRKELEEFKTGIESLVKALQLDFLLSEKEKLQNELNDPNIWQDSVKAAQINRDLSLYNQKILKIQAIQDGLENLEISLELEDEGSFHKIKNDLDIQKNLLDQEMYLSGKFDQDDAILTVYAGAGGVDAQDWAAMVLSMYQAFFKNQNWQSTLISLSAGEEAGIKSATLEINGQNVYGLLKEEAGVHRLVRLSPFNSGNTRETSFAMVEILPANLEKSFQMAEIDQSDLRWDYFMASGNGGQSVNTTYSAVRVTHIPTGIVVVCQNERNQIQNKAQAMKYLRNKLVALELKKQENLKNELRGELVSADWGNQIRNYVLHPYKLVKDTRSGFETSDVDSVLEYGNLIDIIWSVKRNTAEK